MKHHILFCMPLLAASLFPTHAQASLFYVSTSAFGSGTGGTGGIGYNGYNEPQFGFLSSTTGYGVYAGSCYNNAAQPCSVSLMGPTDTTGTLLASSNTAAAITTACTGFNPVCGPSNGQSSATGSLALGKVGVYASGNSYLQNGIDAGGSAASHAAVADQLNFTVAGANANTVTQIGVTFTVTGSLSGTGDSLGEGGAELISGLALGNASEQFITTLNPNTGSPTGLTDSASGWTSYLFSGATVDGGYVFTGTYQVTGSSFSVPLSFALDCSAAGGTTCDYSHTGVISLSLPSGVSYTSASGAFLTGVSAVPEPASFVIAGLGIALVGALRRAAATIRGRLD
jgi:hypothetical protein